LEFPVSRPVTFLEKLAGTTGLEPAASAVTGQRSNQLNYVPTILFLRLIENRVIACFARDAVTEL
jgi:hypothetical protein